jgi:hypothetical protein
VRTSHPGSEQPAKQELSTWQAAEKASASSTPSRSRLGKLSGADSEGRRLLRGEVVVFRFPDRKQPQERQDRRCGEAVADVPESPDGGQPGGDVSIRV